jgi:hypothetical protein
MDAGGWLLQPLPIGRLTGRVGSRGASGWDYYVPYQADFGAALDGLRRRVFADGDCWWTVPGEFAKSASDFSDRPRTEAELWADESVQYDGTHSILDMERVLGPGEKSGCLVRGRRAGAWSGGEA